MSDDVNPFSTEGRSNNPNEPSVHPPPKRNVWIWVIAVIFLMGVGTLVCCGGFAFLGVKQGVAAINAPVDAAVAALNENATVADRLGTPITSTSTFAVEEYENNNGNGSAIVSFNASGSNESATVRGKMNLNSGTWSPESLTVQFSDGTDVTIPEP